jgi:PAS domain S-box-containing protein
MVEARTWHPEVDPPDFVPPDQHPSEVPIGTELEFVRAERMSSHLFFLTLGIILVLTLGLVLFMVPFVYWEGATEVLKDVWRKSFVGFLVLSLLLDVYLLQQQRTLHRVRRQLAKQRSDQELLLAAKKMDEALLRSIGEGVFAVDSESRLILLNRRTEEWAGVRAADSMGRPYREVLRFEKMQVADFAEQAMKSARGVEVGGDALLVKSDESRMPVSVLASPVIDEGVVRGCVVVFRDTTEQRALDRAKTEFISAASHQLRTPLTALRWSASTLAEELAGGMNPRQEELLKEVEGCIDRMVKLVNDLLDVTRLDQGTLMLDRTPVLLNDVVGNVIRSLETKARKYQVSVVVDDALSALPPVRADYGRLWEVLLILVDNAIKYTQERGVVTLQARREDQHVVLSVSDTGVGIPAEEHHKLFKKFSRVDNPLSTRERGSGLGLYFAKGIVEKHGGNIWVESGAGKGSTFCIRLPM